MQGRREEATGGVYADIRRGLPMTENAALRQAQGPERSRGTGGPLSLTALTP
jgi:hypothetical protein